jgi:hypothetical protein
MGRGTNCSKMPCKKGTLAVSFITGGGIEMGTGSHIHRNNMMLNSRRITSSWMTSGRMGPLTLSFTTGSHTRGMGTGRLTDSSRMPCKKGPLTMTFITGSRKRGTSGISSREKQGRSSRRRTMTIMWPKGIRGRC